MFIKNTLLFLAAVLIVVVISLVIAPQYGVYSQEMVGKAELARADQNRKILITQAQAEKEAAQLRADAIRIVGQMAKEFPEYREQEFIGGFSEALKEGKINQIIYVPTEANIPILEAHRLKAN